MNFIQINECWRIAEESEDSEFYCMIFDSRDSFGFKIVHRATKFESALLGYSAVACLRFISTDDKGKPIVVERYAATSYFFGTHEFEVVEADVFMRRCYGTKLITADKNQPGVMLWLDDIRPAPDGYVWCKTVDEAKGVMLSQNVLHASLDHDLGACEKCLKGRSAEQWLADHNMHSMPNCAHFGTGYEFVCWMEEHQIWPVESCMVHSANPVGRERMKKVIDAYYRRNK